MNERNNAIDLSKFIAAILIIGIHINPLIDMSSNVDFVFKEIICRLAVPFFIICSGYFYGKKLKFSNEYLSKERSNWRYLTKQIKKIAILYLGWSLLYLMISIYEWIKIGWFSAYAFVDWVIGLLLYGTCYHFWYLLSMIYAIPILFVILERVRISHLYIVTIILYVIEIIEYGYRIFLPDSWKQFFWIFDKFNSPLVAVTRVVPLLLIGVIIAIKPVRNEEKKYFYCFVIFLICWIGEASILRAFGGTNFSYLIFTIPTSYSLFCFILNCNKYIKWKDSRVLGEMSMVMYCIHPALVWFITKIADINQLFLFIIVVILSVLFGYGYYIIKRFWLKTREVLD